MKFKKLIAMLLTCVLFVPMIGMAEETKVGELLINGDFETLTSNGGFLVWGQKEGISPSSDIKYDGEYSMMISKDYLSQRVYGVLGGGTYTLSGYYMGNVPRVKVDCYKNDENGSRVHLGGEYLDVASATEKRAVRNFRKFSLEYTLPADTLFVDVMLRNSLEESPTTYIDNVSLVGPKTATNESALPSEAIYPPVEGATNLIENGSFEMLTNGVPEPFGCYKGWENNQRIQVLKSEAMAHDGKNCMLITAEKTGINPWINYKIPVEGGARYQILMWICSSISSGYSGMKLEFYDHPEVKAEYDAGYSQSWSHKSTNNVWKQTAVEFVAPDDAVLVAIYPRLFGSGSLYIDDLQCYKIGNTPQMKLNTDQVFYYDDWKHDGIVTVSKTVHFAGPTLDKVEMSFVDGEEVLYEDSCAFVGDSVSLTFPMKTFKEKQKEYKIKVQVLDTDGNVFDRQEQRVYMYPRPSYLNENGDFIIDGEIFNPVFSYHHSIKYWDQAIEMGVNTVQQYNDGVEQGKAILDAAAEKGLKVLANLYGNMRPPSHPDVIESRKAYIESIKDHPALLGYLLFDEPFYNINDPEPYLHDSYKLIRDIDPDHPVLIMDEGGGHDGTTQKYCDVLSIDPYIANLYFLGEDAVGTHPAETVMEADAQAYYNKPIYSLLQAFEFKEYMPTSDELRNMVYQNFLAGAHATGYYCFEESQPGKNLDETELWDGIKAMAGDELDELFDVFIEKKYPVFNELRSDDAWIFAYEKEGKIHYIVQNKRQSEVMVTLPTTSFDGSVNLGNYTVQLTDKKGVKMETGESLQLTMDAVAVVRLVVTPETGTDLSGLTTMQFYDLYNYAWARTEIEKLNAKGLVNDYTPKSFAPGKNITRGDFALFLVRTLGLEGEDAENFADVDPDAEYAKEIAIGRAAGILNGIGDNKYNPEAEISRQDMMTIIARGMKLLGTEADLSGFSDTGLIADYALEGVRAMVGTGLVKGNADGTLNPLGNTTRAEAAVIMSRILAQ
ncbi:MAG: S-layer homology domain-containing protein [Clostridia bacterium]|nr:S-layer homology domain-containing protein [Clostridia bacterium]